MAEPQPHSDQRKSETSDRDAPPTVSLPIDETAQPDLMLQMSTGGKIGVGGFVLIALAIVIIVGVVFYGLNVSGTQ